MAETWFRVEGISPPLILRRTETDAGLWDEAWRDGAWRPTLLILRWMVGREWDVEPVDADTARRLIGGGVVEPVTGSGHDGLVSG